MKLMSQQNHNEGTIMLTITQPQLRAAMTAMQHQSGSAFYKYLAKAMHRATKAQTEAIVGALHAEILSFVPAELR